MIPTVQIPKKLEFLFQPSRYKVAHGGRGATKSWTFAAVLIILSMQSTIRVGCFREIQNSIKESVHKLIKDQIERMGIVGAFEITEHSIKCRSTGSEFIFEGLFRNVNRIKSLEGIDIAWVEEAEKVSDESWGILTPTIRKPGSEIWVSFNVQFEDDATYQRFVVSPPSNAVVVEVNYYDNPWFPEVLEQERLNDKARDNIKYQNVWLGKPLGSGRRVWHAFNREVHVKSFDIQDIKTRGNCYMAMDPHSHYFPFCVWVAMLKKNDRGRPEDFHRHVYAEWPTYADMGGYYHDLRHKMMFKDSIEDMANIIKAKDSQGGIKILGHFIDPRFAKGAGAWNWSTSTEGVVEQFQRPENGGIDFLLPEIVLLDVQRQVIHSNMVWDETQGMSWNNEPTFSVDPSCRNLIASLMNHRLEDESEKESEKYKDASDALRICFAGFSGRGFEGLIRDKALGKETAPSADYKWKKQIQNKKPVRGEAWRTI